MSCFPDCAWSQWLCIDVCKFEVGAYFILCPGTSSGKAFQQSVHPKILGRLSGMVVKLGDTRAGASLEQARNLGSLRLACHWGQSRSQGHWRWLALCPACCLSGYKGSVCRYQSGIWGYVGLSNAEFYCDRTRVGDQGKVLYSLFSLFTKWMTSLSILCCLGLGKEWFGKCKTVLPTPISVFFLMTVLCRMLQPPHLVSSVLVNYFCV